MIDAITDNLIGFEQCCPVTRGAVVTEVVVPNHKVRELKDLIQQQTGRRPLTGVSAGRGAVWLTVEGVGLEQVRALLGSA